MALLEYWTLARTADNRWMVVSIEQKAEGDHHLDAEVVASPWSDSRIADESLTEVAAADKLPEGFTTADLAELDFDEDARARALDLSLADARFAPDVLEAAARQAVAAWAEAVDGPDEALAQRASPEALQVLLYGSDTQRTTRLVVRGPRVQRISIESCECRAAAGDDDDRRRARRPPLRREPRHDDGGRRATRTGRPPSPSAGRSRSTGRTPRRGGSSP